MTRIGTTFRRLGKAGQVAAIPYLPVGISDVQTSRVLLPIIGRQGADLIALGTTLTMRYESGEDAVPTGASLDDCLSIAAEARRTNEVPHVLVATRADAEQYGFEGLAIHSAQSGIDGILIPDLSLDDFGIVAPLFAASGVDAIPAISPALSEADLAKLAHAVGFAYCPVFVFSELANTAVRDRIADVTELPLVIGVDEFLLDTMPGGTKLGDGILARTGLSEIIVAHPEDEIMLEVSDHVRVIQDSIRKAGW